MLKDFMHAIFKEDIDEEEIMDEEVVEEPEEVVEEKTEPQPQPVPEVVIPEQDRYVRPQPKPLPDTLVTEVPVVQAAPQEDPKSSIFNGMDIETISARTPKRVKSNYKFDRSKLNKRMSQQETAEYQAVISPIFGNLEDEKKEFDKVHDAIQLPKPDDDFSFVQVISPMYGNDIPSAKPVSNIPVYDVPSTLEREPKKTMDLSELLEKKEEKKTTQESLFKNTK